MLAFFEKLENGQSIVRLIEFVDQWSDNPDLPITGKLFGLDVFDLTLQDKDPQSLVDTLNRMGWNWIDGDQYKERKNEAA